MTKIYTFLVVLLCCNFFSVSMAQAPNWNWAVNPSGTAADYAQSVATDSDGNVYVTGAFSSPTLDFGGHVLYNSGLNDFDVFIAKYNPAGNVIWAKSVNGAGFDYSYKIVVDNFNNLYITGWYSSLYFTFDNITLPNPGISSDIFVAKYDSAGNVLWATRAGGDLADLAYDIAVDHNQNVYITGNFQSATATFGNTVLINAGGIIPVDAFVAKLDSVGNILWAKAAGGAGTDYGTGITVSPSGEIYATGNFASPTIVFGGTTLTNTGMADAYTVKYDAAGNAQWAKSIGGPGFESGGNLVTDMAGNVYLMGGFNSPSITVGTTTLTNAGSGDALLVQYDPAGNVGWAKSFGSSDTNAVAMHSLSTDHAGGLYMAGAFSVPSLTIGNTTLTSIGNFDALVVKYDIAGNPVWAKGAGSPASEGAYSAYPDGNGNVYVCGPFATPVFVLGNTTLSTTGGDDVFLAKLSPGGLWNEKENLPSVQLYPNPSPGIFMVALPEDAQEIYIHNALGQFISKHQVKGKQQWEFHLPNEGIYFIEVKTPNDTFTGRLIIAR